MRISIIALLITFVISRYGLKKKSISGRVVDAETGVALPFASISFNDYSNGSVSNSEGVYVIDIPADRMGDSSVFQLYGI